MKLMTSIILSLCLYTSIEVKAQNCFDKIADSSIVFNEDTAASWNNLVKNLNCFIGKGLDETDIKIIVQNKEWIGVFMTDILTEQEELTYRILHAELLQFVQDEEYKANKANLSNIIDFFALPADINSWEKDKLLIVNTGIEEEELDNFEIYLKEYSDPSRTYKEVFKEFSDLMVDNDFDMTDYSLFEKQNTFDLEATFKMSENEMMPIVLYFTGHAVVNARKIEQMITDDMDLFLGLADDFIFISLYCDDVTPLEKSKQFYSEDLKKQITTEGELAAHYQIKYFKRSDQPYFVGINYRFEKLAELTFNMNPDAVLEFMDEVDSGFYGLDKLKEK